MSSSSQNRLKRAVQVYLEEIVENQRSPDEVLDEHRDLHDLLEPMINEDTAPEMTDEPFVTALDDSAILDDFRIVREIGRGGMGVVYEAQQISLERRVALKVLRPESSAKPEAMVRFRREAASIASLDHEGIVGVHATGMARETCYIAMDLVIGAPLDAVLQGLREGVDAPEQARLPSAVARSLRHEHSTAAESTGTSSNWGSTFVGQVVEVAAQVAEALAHAHDRGVIHRDVKPANILLRPDGRAVLTDFGLSQLADSSPVTVTGGLSGTVYYLAPEQIERKQRVDGRADVFALGVTLYEMLTLIRPFDGETTGQVMHAIVKEEPANPQKRNPQLTADLVAIIGKAIEKDPARRYQTAAEFAADLRAFLAYRPIRARQPGPMQRAVRWARREPVRAALAALLFFAMLGLVGFAGYLVARQPELAAGAAALRTAELEEMLTDGFLEYGEGSRDLAVEHFRRAFAFAPDSAEALTGLALTAESKQGTDAALEVLERADPALGTQRPVRRLRLHILRRAGLDDEAQRLADELGPPTETLEFYVEGLREIDRGHDGDRDAFHRAARHLHWATLLSDRPRPVFYFQWAHAVGHTNDRDASELCVTALQRFWPESWKTWFWIKWVWYGKEPERAALAAGRAAALRPNAPKLLLELSAAEVDPQRAEQACRRALELKPSWVLAMVQMAKLRGKQGDMTGSAEWLARASAVDPEAAAVQGGKGLDLLRRGNATAAIPHLQRAIEGNPVDADPLFYLGRAHQARRDTPAAIAAYEACVKVNPYHAEALTNWANALRHSGNVAEAETLYRRAIDIRPSLSQPREGMRFLLQAERRTDDLRRHLDAWVEGIPDDPVARFMRGKFIAEFGPGNKRENDLAAIRELEQAVSLPGGDQDSRISNTLGCLLVQVGKLEEGEVLLLRACELAEHNRFGEAHKKRLATHLAQCRELLARRRQQETKR